MNANLLNNQDVFSQASPCPLVNGDVTLYKTTWESHIKIKHPEVAGALQHIQNAIANPAYVARSLPGPNQIHADNLVFVSVDAKIRTSILHVFVESPQVKPTISTAVYMKRRHADVLWTNEREDVHASYDAETDVLYISKDEPVPSLTEEGADGLLLRYAISDDKPCGVTVVSFHQTWAGHEGDLATRIAKFLDVTPSSAERALMAIS